MKMLLSRFPEEIALAVDGWVYIEIRKGMYTLKHTGLSTVMHHTFQFQTHAAF
jgi:hypothetical protein